MGSLLDDLAHLTGTVGVPAVTIGASTGGGQLDSRPGGGLPLRGQSLRYVLSLQLSEAHELTVAELVRRVEAAGYRIVGRASKSVSDALRWEIGRGRVVRIGRGRYRFVRIPRSTRRRMQRRLDDLHAAWRADVETGADTGADGAADTGVDTGVEVGAGRSSWFTPATRPRRPAGAPPTGLDLYRRQQRARRAWEATLGPRPTWRRWITQSG